MKYRFEAESPKIRWGKLLTKTAVWVSVEVALNVVGLDTIADYSEFLFQHPTVTQMAEAFTNLITSV